MKRILYLGYHLRKLDYSLFWRWTKYVAEREQISVVRIIFSCLYSVLKYKISILEYFQFQFYKKNDAERSVWAGTGFMYEYQLRMNPPDKRAILDDKRQFYRAYRQFMIHAVADLADLKVPATADRILKNPSGKLVFKEAHGKCGVHVLIRPVSEFESVSVLESFMKREGFDLVEEFIEQHDALNQLSPSAVNTVRIFTQLNENNEVVLLGCRLRISVNSKVDNLAAGNIAAPVDDESGVVNGPGIYSDITKDKKELQHPVTGVAIAGFQIPYWPEIISLVKAAALLHPENRSIGWDVVVTNRGPGLIEGNHDWCKLVWQLPVGKGLLPVLKRFI